MDTLTFIQLSDFEKIKAIDSCQFDPTKDKRLLFENTFSSTIFQKLVDCKANLYVSRTHLITLLIQRFSMDSASRQMEACKQMLYIINTTDVTLYRGRRNTNLLHELTMMMYFGGASFFDLFKYILKATSLQSQIHWCLSEFDYDERTPSSTVCFSSTSMDNANELLDIYAKMTQQFRNQLSVLIYPILQIKDIIGIVLDFSSL